MIVLLSGLDLGLVTTLWGNLTVSRFSIFGSNLTPVRGLFKL